MGKPIFDFAGKFGESFVVAGGNENRIVAEAESGVSLVCRDEAFAGSVKDFLASFRCY